MEELSKILDPEMELLLPPLAEPVNSRIVSMEISARLAPQIVPPARNTLTSVSLVLVEPHWKMDSVSPSDSAEEVPSGRTSNVFHASPHALLAPLTTQFVIHAELVMS